MKANYVGAIVALLFCAFFVGQANAEDWPQWRGINRDGKSPESNLFEKWGADGPPQSYVSEGLGAGYAGVSVANGRVFCTGNKPDGQVVTAMSASQGKILWQTPLTDESPKHGYEGSRCTPTVDGERVYVVTSDGSIVCLAVDSGDRIWAREFSDWNGRMMSGWGFSESPLVDGKLVLCTPGGDTGVVVALDKMTGEEVWACKLPDFENEDGLNGKLLRDGAGYASLIISHGGGVKQYVQLVGRGLIGIRAEDGKLLWRYPRVANGTANIPTAIAKDDYIFTSTAYGTGSALLRLVPAGSGNVEAEEVYWLEGNELQNKHGGMVLVGDYIFCGTGNGQGLPICVNMLTGEIAWGPVRGEGRGEASLIYADNHLVIRRDNGTVMLVKATAESFQLVASFMPEFQQGKSWAHPVIANGRLYLREQDKLMVYQLGGGN